MMLAMNSIQFLLVPLPQHEQKGHIFCLPHHTPSYHPNKNPPLKKSKKKLVKSVVKLLSHHPLTKRPIPSLNRILYTPRGIAWTERLILPNIYKRVKISEAWWKHLTRCEYLLLKLAPANLFVFFISKSGAWHALSLRAKSQFRSTTPFWFLLFIFNK